MRSKFNIINQNNNNILQNYYKFDKNLTFKELNSRHNRSRSLDFLSINPSAPISGIRV